eukprot:14980792-Heterocapsa_arctica.AAC.1
MPGAYTALSFANEAAGAWALAQPWGFAIDPSSGIPQRRAAGRPLGRSPLERLALARSDADVSNRARR